jgi:hypothetical protein
MVAMLLRPAEKESISTIAQVIALFTTLFPIFRLLIEFSFSLFHDRSHQSTLLFLYIKTYFSAATAHIRAKFFRFSVIIIFDPFKSLLFLQKLLPLQCFFLYNMIKDSY